jgi:light-harvesting protein B-800-850 alpha chain
MSCPSLSLLGSIKEGPIMNQARIWLVVSPTVGLPLLLGSVAVTALLVHTALVGHTTWFSAYWQGGKTVKAAVETAPLQQVGELTLPSGAKVAYTTAK